MKTLLASLCALTVASGLSQTYTASIHLPSGASESMLRRGAGGTYGGYTMGSGVSRAQILGPNGWVDLTPAGQTYCRLLDVFRTHQVGYCGNTYTNGASLWRGTANSFLNLHVQGMYSSAAYAMEGKSVVGYTVDRLYDPPRAAVWTSASPTAWVDVHPAGWTSSILQDTDGVRHVGVMNGSGYRHAGLWLGNTPNAINLNPSWASESIASAMHNGYQVGTASRAGRDHAVRWAGSRSSVVSLHPPFAYSSAALGIHNGVVVGYITQSGLYDRYAAVLESPFGPIDLHQFLPSQYVRSCANGISDNGVILGEAYLSNGTMHTVTWEP